MAAVAQSAKEHVKNTFLNGLSLPEVARGLWKQLRADRILGHSAQLSFYFLLSTFPLLIVATALLGYFLEVRSLLNEAIRNYLFAIAPQSATGLLSKTLSEITSRNAGGKISFGLLGALWVGSTGVLAIIKSLNMAYEVKELRPWWKRRLVAVVLAVAVIVFLIVSLVLLVAGGKWIEEFAHANNLDASVMQIWTVLQWIVVLGFVFTAFFAIYLFGPNVKHSRYSHLVLGTACGVCAWLLVSMGFKIYLLFFNRYNVTYGSIGVVIILLLWFYFTGIAILLGGEINSVVEKRGVTKPTKPQGARA